MQQPGQHPQYEYQPVYQQPHSPQFVDQQQPLQQQYADQQQHNQQYFDQQQYGQQQYVGQQHGVNQQQYPQRQRPLEPSQSPLPEVVPPQHAYYNQGHNAPEVVVADYPQTVYQADKPGSVPLPQYYGRVPPPAGQEKRICGLSRRLFIILATVIVVLVVGAVVGGAVGGTVGKKGSSGGGGGSDSVAATTTATSAPTTTPTPVPTNPAALLGNSSISSANYTDARGFSHSLVFWQSASAKLLVSSWDGENRTWQTTSISAKLEGSGITLSFLVGTPIAATAYLETSGPKIRLYALTSTSTIIELYNDDITTASQGNWKQGSLGTQAILKAGAGSQLAVHHPPCAGPGSCMTQTFLLYQDSSQAVKICWFPWQPSTLALANNGTGLAATNVYGLVNGAPNYTDPGLRLYYDSSGIIQEAIIGLDLSVYFYGKSKPACCNGRPRPPASCRTSHGRVRR